MANRDIRSNLKHNVVFDGLVNSNTITESSSIDTFGYDSGVMFSLFVTAGDGDFIVSSIQESDDNVSFSDIDVDKLIGTYADTAMPTLPADEMVTLGCFSTKRYLKILIESTNVTVGRNMFVTAIMKGDNLPVE